MDGMESLAAQIAALADFRTIGLKKVLQFGTFLGTIYGAWKWWRFSKWQIAKRLLEYLDNEEKNIIECRDAVLNHIRYGKPLSLAPNHRLHPEIEEALKDVARAEPGRAEQRLICFVATLTEDAGRFSIYEQRQPASRYGATLYGPYCKKEEIRHGCSEGGLD
jgi:hypothetical protein